MQGLAGDVQASVWVRADGQKFVDLTTNDGKALNNGQDKLVEDGYNATTGALATALTEQTNGTDVVMTLNANNTTSVQEFSNNTDGSVNWTSLRGTQTLQGLAGDVQASVWSSGGKNFVDLTTNDGMALNNGKDKLVEDAYNATTGALTATLIEQTNDTDVLMTFNANNTTTVQEFRNNKDGSVNWTSLATATFSGMDTDIGANDSGKQTIFTNFDSLSNDTKTAPDTPGGVVNSPFTPEPTTPDTPTSPSIPVPSDPVPWEPEPAPTITTTPTTNNGGSSGGSGGDTGGSSSGGCDDDDPIILNLHGEKVQTTALSGSGTYFDMQNNGHKVQTGWATAGEGMLVYDPNNTGTVTQDSSLVAGFGALSTLAKRSSGTLDAGNPLWNQLKVWVDQNGDATCQQGELKTFDQLGIASIKLDSTAEHVDSKGNTILNDSSFTWKNGGTGDIAGVGLAFNPNAPALNSFAAVVNMVCATPNSNSTSGSLNHLIQAMASFNSGNTGIDPTFVMASANAGMADLVASHLVRHA
ncbi:hypothetical protein AAKU55_005865 [Oxalobacteraceae bacterium GrIS 1.11]